MSYAIKPRTPEGERAIALAEGLVVRFQARADAADRTNEICADNYRDMRTSGVAAAFVPEELGGLGLRSMHDWTLLIATLAKGDGSAAIAISMHLSATRGLATLHRATEPGSPARRRAQGILEAVGRGEMLICSTTTERGTDNLHPLAEARRVEDRDREGDGWSLTGTKHFVTMSPLATHVATNVRMRDEHGDHIANILLPMDTPGISQGGDWDALGMRASGSQSVSFAACRVPLDALRVIGPWGRWSTPILVARTLANVPLVGAFLGIAETAMHIAVEGQSKAPARAGAHHALAEMEIKLATSQSILARLGETLDAFMDGSDEGRAATYEQGHALMKDYQSAKWVVNRNAIDIVGQAMDLAGGGGFMARNPLSRLYRDVRAGPFMQPYSPVDARAYIGKVLVGDLPEE